MIEYPYKSESLSNSYHFSKEDCKVADFKFDFEIVKNFGTVSESNNGWVKEVNLVSWNEREPVYDIRVWQEGHEKLGKGITLTEEELKNLKNLLNTMDI